MPLHRMKLYAFDVESHLVRPGLTAPKLVCVSIAHATEPVCLLDAKDGLAWFRAAIQDPEITLVGHHVPYDLGVMCAEDSSLTALVFAAIDAGRVRCTLLRERLLDCADGKLVSERVAGYYSLDKICQRRLQTPPLDKGEDGWRLRYAELDGVPLAEWPERASQYAKLDAIMTLALHESQQANANARRSAPVWASIPDEVPQMRAGWALHLLSMWGVRTDGERVAAYKASLLAERDAIDVEARAAGLVREDGTRDQEVIRARLEAACARLGVPVARTGKTRAVSIAGEYLKAAGKACDAWPQCQRHGPCVPSTNAPDGCTGDPLLVKMARFDSVTKLLGTYVSKLELATRVPLNARYTTMLETGRTSATDNAQTPPRKGDVRGCYRPRDGWVFGSADYDGAELRSWAQVCLDLVGHSKLASLYQKNPDADPHSTMGALLLGVPEEEFLARRKAGDPVAAEYRQQSKPANFGFPGGMGEPAMIAYAAGQDIVLTPQRAAQARAAWRAAWPENFDYFKFIGALTSGDGNQGTIKQLRSGRVRGNVGFTQAANGFFQGLTADGAKRALWLVSWECYVGTCYDDHSKPSPLAGSRPVKFLHDEIVAEMLEALAAAAAERLAVVMVAGMREFLPDVPVRTSPVLMRRWSKSAKSVRDASGTLIPWEDAVAAPARKAA